MKLWEQVKKLEEQDDFKNLRGQLTEIDMTLNINYGENGKTMPGMVKDNDPPLQKMVRMFTYYHRAIYPETEQKSEGEKPHE